MLMVQISDLHVGSQFLDAKFHQLVDEVNKVQPDVVVVTGDLTNQGIVGEYEKCSKLLSTIHTKRLIAVSGNHDYRNTGYLLFRKYFPSNNINELGDNVILATIGTARPDRNEGEVGYRQNLWLENTLKKFHSRIILVAMHHHLIDVPDTGSDHQTVRDAGDVLRTILNSGVSLVLCGHNHRPWMWDFGKLKVVNAGTATSERPRGLFENSYNIITIQDGEVGVDLKIVGGSRMHLSDMVQKHSLFDSP
ncbi:MAG: metallophosphoesterase [Cenarchaeum sp. SB0665_bin_23]|nr:metallophosphoesterase [Cenarchaeum sp. SB0667_bin_13]MXY61411.1 metallophosphoesterase [Cenarchaeum sp. SB0665_bin_23]MXZ92989.1 metallophosphoesterase [Cenarchaeum sp. SB0666_bin_15]MYB47005.1 metallophosphoesterase [Cenarchaeum sp. SB0662_bin_33]MYC79676.1 metallophosphoesterase [Cenarchaeum sp. SB0661_bin_35]MYD58725.1 metallophosphoesterase [Cenarchaeum sp. SB0678_bin_8]MYG32641.1 metallophosphoesterase [Cenarchaeum sp. SB0677_bin_16]MYI51402.1 metallophosphoesterase [Cenarchaeum sp.